MTMLIIALLFFIAIAMGLIALSMGYETAKSSPAFELKRRLRKLAVRADDGLPSELAVEILHEMTSLDKALYKLRPVRWLDRLMDSAGMRVDVKIFLLVILVSGLIGLGVGASLGRGTIAAVALLFVGMAAPLVYLRVRGQRRYIRFTEQFPGALDMIARSLRTGHSFSSAIQMVGTDMPEPIAGLFKTVYDEQTLGLSMNDALLHMMERIPSVDLRLFVTAVNIHREVGGNLAETLEKLAQTIRERLKLRRQVRVYTAQGRLSGYILAALPIFMALFLYTAAPDYLMELWKVDEGKYAIALVISGQIIGFLIIRKLINIKI
jgi:tight adherence protein B